MKYRNSGANEEHIIQNRFTAYLLVALQRRKVDFLLRRYSHQQHEQPVEAINTAYASIYDLEDAICQTLDLQTEYAALMRLLVTLPERERTILLSRAMENRSFAESQSFSNSLTDSMSLFLWILSTAADNSSKECSI